MKIQTENIPAELLQRKQWVVWKWKERDGKLTKPPYKANGGGRASSTDASTWSTFSEALNAYENGKADGVGFVFSNTDSYCGLDFDDCRDLASDECETEAWNWIKEVDSYTEVSPSGKGYKTFLRGRLPQGGHHGGQIEVYDTGRYFTITGERLNATSANIEDRQEELDELVRHYWPEDFDTGAEVEPETDTGNEIEDEQLIKLALEADDLGKFARLWGGDFSDYASQSEADLALACKLAFWTNKDPERIDRLFRQSGLMRKKWNRKDYRGRTVKRALEQTTETYRPGEAVEIEPEEGPLPEAETKNLDFPEWILAGAAGEFAHLYTNYLEVPTHFFYISFLTCLGSVLADKLTLASEIAQQPRLYVLLLGESADDRKSTALDKAIGFFRDAIPSFNVCWGVGSAEGLQRRLDEDDRLLLCLDEFKSFVSKCKIQGSVLLPCVNSLFQSNYYENTTKKSEIYIDDAYLSVLAASTIQTYSNTWSSAFTDIGFNNRLFLVPGTGIRKFSVPKKIPLEKKTRLKQRLKEVVQFTHKTPELDMEQSAREAYHQWYMEIEQSVHARRIDTYALRFLPLLAINEGKSIVDQEVVRKVIALCDWQYTVRKLHDPIDADNTIAKVEESIRRVLRAKGPLKDRELRQFANIRRVGLWIYDSAKKNLTRAGELGFHRKERKYFYKDHE